MKKQYNREKAIEYAYKWAYGRNKQYYAFDGLGGDCTNFISQCLYAGTGVMNYTPVYGWFYINLNNRTPAWTGVEFFYHFLTSNRGPGPTGELTDMFDVEPGDIIQLKFAGLNRFTHSLMINDIKNPVTEANIFVTTHDRNCFNCPLNLYIYDSLRFIKITGVNR